MPKLSEFQNLPVADSNDIIPIIDVSEVLPQNQNKKITVENLLASGNVIVPLQNIGGAPISTPVNGTMVLDQSGNGTLYIRVNNTWKSVSLT